MTNPCIVISEKQLLGAKIINFFRYRPKGEAQHNSIWNRNLKLLGGEIFPPHSCLPMIVMIEVNCKHILLQGNYSLDMLAHLMLFFAKRPVLRIVS